MINLKDAISQKVCSKCCQITIKMFQFRTSALKNDLELKKKYGLLKNKDGKKEEKLKRVDSNMGSLVKSQSTTDPSVQEIFKKHPTLKIPVSCLKKHLSPKSVLSSTDVFDYFKKYPISNGEYFLTNNIVDNIRATIENRKRKITENSSMNKHNNIHSAEIPKLKIRRVEIPETSARRKSFSIVSEHQIEKSNEDVVLSYIEKSETIHLCDICNLVTYNLKELKAHKRSHLLCPFCKTFCRSFGDKKKHIEKYCHIKNMMNNLPSVDLNKVEYDVQARLKFPDAFTSFSPLKNVTSYELNDLSTAPTITYDETPTIQKSSTSRLIPQIKGPLYLLAIPTSPTKVIHNKSLQNVGNRKKPDEVLCISDDEESTNTERNGKNMGITLQSLLQPKATASKVDNVTQIDQTTNKHSSPKYIALITKPGVMNGQLTVGDTLVNVNQKDPKKSGAPHTNNALNTYTNDDPLRIIPTSNTLGKNQPLGSVGFIKPQIEILNNNFLNEIDIRSTDIKIIKDLILTACKPKLIKEAVVQTDMPTNDNILLNRFEKTCEFRQLKKVLSSYKVPVTIQNGRFNAKFDYNNSKIQTEKKDMHMWHFLASTDIKINMNTQKSPLGGKLKMPAGAVPVNATKFIKPVGNFTPTPHPAAKIVPQPTSKYVPTTSRSVPKVGSRNTAKSVTKKTAKPASKKSNLKVATPISTSDTVPPLCLISNPRSLLKNNVKPTSSTTLDSVLKEKTPDSASKNKAPTGVSTNVTILSDDSTSTYVEKNESNTTSTINSNLNSSFIDISEQTPQCFLKISEIVSLAPSTNPSTSTENCTNETNLINELNSKASTTTIPAMTLLNDLIRSNFANVNPLSDTNLNVTKIAPSSAPTGVSLTIPSTAFSSVPRDIVKEIDPLIGVNLTTPSSHVVQNNLKEHDSLSNKNLKATSTTLANTSSKFDNRTVPLNITNNVQQNSETRPVATVPTIRVKSVWELK